MAWPPPVLPINRTNADQQKDTHPADHNALALAINDTVPVVKKGVPAAGKVLFPVGGTAPAGTIPQIVTGYASITANAGGTASFLIPGSPGPLGMVVSFVITAQASAPGQDVVLMINARDATSVYVHVIAGGVPWASATFGFTYIAFIA